MGLMDMLKGGSSGNDGRDAVEIQNRVGIITTTAGTIHVFFYPDVAPAHVRNFIYLAEKGFYSGSPFHRIVDQFVIQTGEARPGWKEKVPPMQAEFSSLLHQRGTLAAARTSDPNSATSQFYLVIARTFAHHLDRQYTVFGQAFRGLEIIDTIAQNWLDKTARMGEREAERTPGDDTIVSVEIVDAGPFSDEIADCKRDLLQPSK